MQQQLKLYHYTDQAGFLGIIEEKELWATKIQYLNDNKEFVLAIEIASELLTKKLASASSDINKEIISDVLENILLNSVESVFVCSLSEKDDSLSQWRGYSKGMAGYAIGFDAALLSNMANENGCELKQCIYDLQKQKDEIQKVIEHSLAGHYVFPDEFKDEEKKEYIKKALAGTLSRELALLFPLIKHESFKDEAEWRIIGNFIKLHHALCFRPGNSTLIPFIKIKSANGVTNAIYKVTIGHTPNKELALSATRDFLRTRNVNALINESLIPFRNW
ncbi:DUF2971 family protein [Rahnella aquatilis]|nr:DUF2971 family protein [Rahnella aquatilis]